MKRAHAESSLPEDASPPHASKRTKVSDEEENGEGWQKVERRKSKKHKKAEAKLHVRFPPSSSSAASTMYVYHTPVQAAPPKFMYAKNEILRRRDAVGINVSACCSRVFCLANSFPTGRS